MHSGQTYGVLGLLCVVVRVSVLRYAKERNTLDAVLRLCANILLLLVDNHISLAPSPLSAMAQPPRRLRLTRTLTTRPLAELLHYADSACAAWGSLCSPPNQRRRWPGGSAANMELKQAEATLSQAATVPGGCQKEAMNIRLEALVSIWFRRQLVQRLGRC